MRKIIGLAENLICNRPHPNEAVAHSEERERRGRLRERVGPRTCPPCPFLLDGWSGLSRTRRVGARFALPVCAYKCNRFTATTNEGNDSGASVCATNQRQKLADVQSEKGKAGGSEVCEWCHANASMFSEKFLARTLMSDVFVHLQYGNQI